MRDQLWQGLQSLGGVKLNGSAVQRLAHNLNVSFEGVDGARLHSALRRRLAVSGGSACSSDTAEPSHVLLALGRSRQEAAASVRFGLGRSTTAQQIDHALERIDQGVGNECEQCGNDIDPRRLQVLPYTTVCVDCAAD
mgnify:CR=1 FL=1